MSSSRTPIPLLDGLNDAQRRAVVHGDTPLLIVAGAGTGKTTTLARRVAWLIHRGVDPGRVLLLTFTRRAAAEMIRRADGLLAAAGSVNAAKAIWGGTFHAVAVRLLRRHGPQIGLPADFTIIDRSDADDLFGSLRADLGYAEAGSRFPAGSLCTDVYSRVVNSQQSLEDVLRDVYPALQPHVVELKALFRAYTTRKEREHLLDYDDLLLFWEAVLADAATAEAVRGRFAHVLVDEYQDTNRLQAAILRRLCPDGTGLTVVGDDAQAIYAFRAATVRNILDFPQEYPQAETITLVENYRSTQPILDVANAVILAANERHEKTLHAVRPGGEPPTLIRCDDEGRQSEVVVDRIVQQYDAGIALRDQAVLFRAAFHSLTLELELNRRGIPYRKYGGVKLLEAAHIKDLLAFLRLAENPRDSLAVDRVLLLLPGIGRKTARTLTNRLVEADYALPEAWQSFRPTAMTREIWPAFLALIEELTATANGPATPASQIHDILTFTRPLLEDRYDNAAVRLRDLEQLELVAEGYRDRAAFLTDLTLDPPATRERETPDDEADDDALILSTVHSAKGLEFDAVHILTAVEGAFPSSQAGEAPEAIDEERRLFYVALTRARTHLAVYQPLRFSVGRSSWNSPTGLASLTRFLTPDIQQQMTIVPAGRERESTVTTGDVRRRIGRLWD